MVVFTPFGLWKFSSVFPQNSKMRNIILWLYRILLHFLLWKYLGGFQKISKMRKYLFYIIFWLYQFVLRFYSENTWVVSKNFKNEKIFILYYFSGYAGLYSNFSLEIRGWFPKFQKWKIFIFYLRGCIVFALFVLWK